MEEGYLRLKAKLPVVLTVVKEINEPRLPSLKGKMAAKKAAITVLEPPGRRSWTRSASA